MSDNHEYISIMKQIQNKILKFIENDQADENDFEKIIHLCDEYEILGNKNKFKSILYIILNISNNHHRNINFFDKIFGILNHFKDYINENYSNNEIFNVFKSNKRILLYLFEEKIININKIILSTLYKYEKYKYLQYFYNEIKSFNDDEIKIDEILKEIPDDFEEKRKIGENDTYICQLIQKDMVDDFVVYVNQTNFPIKTAQINPSLFETNSYLLQKKPTLIEYSAFFGSIQIFRYLYMNNAQLTPSLFFYAIHGSNSDIIHILEENNAEMKFSSYDLLLDEAITCHHKNLIKYIIDNYFDIDDTEKVFHNCLLDCLKSYNFQFMKSELLDKSFFEDLCEWDYFYIVNYFLQEDDIDINAQNISINFIFILFLIE